MPLAPSPAPAWTGWPSYGPTEPPGRPGWLGPPRTPYGPLADPSGPVGPPTATVGPPLPALIAARLQTALSPWMTAALALYCQAVASLFDPVAGLVFDQGSDGTPAFVPGWGVLFDPVRCPTAFLPYLAQYVGVQIPNGTTDTAARSLILAEAGLNRGTLAAVTAAVKRNLVGTQSVVIIERVAADATTLDAYRAVIIVRPEEVVSLTALLAAANAVKPGGIILSVTQTDYWTWAQATGTWNTDTMTWNQAATQRP